MAVTKEITKTSTELEAGLRNVKAGEIQDMVRGFIASASIADLWLMHTILSEWESTRAADGDSLMGTIASHISLYNVWSER